MKPIWQSFPTPAEVEAHAKEYPCLIGDVSPMIVGQWLGANDGVARIIDLGVGRTDIGPAGNTRWTPVDRDGVPVRWEPIASPSPTPTTEWYAECDNASHGRSKFNTLEDAEMFVSWVGARCNLRVVEVEP